MIVLGTIKFYISSTEKYKLEPNSMQVGFITNLRRIVDAGENRALLISATGTGKTYASAFAMRELGFKRVLFLVHRSTLAKQALTSFRKVFEDKKSMGIVGAGYSDYEADYIFAMVETLHKADNLRKFDPEEFDCIVLDEAHHSPANTYQKVMEYFKPKLFLGMTATPDKRDDVDASRNVYELFHYQIAYEIRLQQAMEEDLLCPFHYFGISDISMITDEQAKARNISEEYFGRLTGDERVRHVIEQARYYGYSGDRVKGLIFCSRNRECEELSAKFNRLGYRTVALSGKNTDREREAAFERLAMNEEDATEEMQPLDYIFSVDILNEGWEFPGGKIEVGETPQQAVVREIREELDATVRVGDLIDTIEYDYPAFHLSMDCFWCEVASGELKLLETEAARWLTKEELDSVQWLPADVTLIDKIRKCME